MTQARGGVLGVWEIGRHRGTFPQHFWRTENTDGLDLDLDLDGRVTALGVDRCQETTHVFLLFCLVICGTDRAELWCCESHRCIYEHVFWCILMVKLLVFRILGFGGGILGTIIGIGHSLVFGVCASCSGTRVVWHYPPRGFSVADFAP